MSKAVLITLTTAGADTGPFDLYSNADSYAVPFDTNVDKADLVAGYVATPVPDSATSIRVASVSACTNFVDLPISALPITTTTSTTTTTTTILGNCGEVNISNADLTDATGNTLYLNNTVYIVYINTSGVIVEETFSTSGLSYVCGTSSGQSPDIYYYKNNNLVSVVDSTFQLLGSNCTQPLNCYTVYEHFLGYVETNSFYIPDCCGAASAFYFDSCWDAVVVNISAIGNIRWFDCDGVEQITYIGSTGNYNLVGCVRYNSIDNGVPVPLQPATIVSVNYGNSLCNI
jgi:hypothetical protein